MTKVRLSIAGVDQVTGLEALAGWLREEPELRGGLTLAAAPRPGELGGLADVLIAAVGGGGAVSVLFTSLQTYLAQPRHSDVRITVEVPDGRKVELDAKRVRDAEALVRSVLEQAE